MEYDVIVIGGASAGLTAAIYAARRAMKTLVITKNIGGQALETNRIENYPGFLAISGPNLMKRFQKQALRSGAEIVFDEVKELEESDSMFRVKTDTNEYMGKAIILAFGKTPKTLNVIGEKEFLGKGVSYCATCDLPLFKNKTIAVVGGGNSAFDAALYGSKITSKVYLIHRKSEFRAFEYLIESVKKRQNIEFVLNSVVKEIKGDNVVSSVVVEDVNTKETKELKVQGVFIEIGSEVKTDFIRNLVKLDENGHVVINNNCETFYPDSEKIRPGIFAAGDITITPFKQIVVSAGEGCKAALQAYNYLHKIKPAFIADWVAKH